MPRDVIRVVASLLLSKNIEVAAFRVCCKAARVAVDEAVQRIELRLRSRSKKVESRSRAFLLVEDVAPAEVQRLLFRIASNIVELTVQLSPDSMSCVDLSACTKLSHVNLFYHCYYYPNSDDDVLAPLATCKKHLRTVVIACPFLKNLATLSELAELRCLTLEYCNRLTDLAPLKNCEHLDSLQLKHCSVVSDFTPMLSCTKLRRLITKSCSPSMFDDINGPLQLCVHPLRELCLHFVSSRGLSDLGPLRECGRTLRKLVLTFIRAEDLSPLATCTELRELHLECSVYDISPLACCKKLRSVYLGGCNVHDLSPLSMCTEIKALFIPRCPGVTDLTSLGSHLLSKLTELDVAGCRNLASLPSSSTSTSPSKKLSNLSALNLTCCTKLTDLSPLAACSRLTYLNLAYCSSLTDLSPLTGCLMLVELDLSGCVAVTDLSPLAKCSHLVELDLTGLEKLTEMRC